MGLTFTVGIPANVFLETFADQVEQALARDLNYSIPSPLEADPYYSEEVEWFGWAQFQQMAVMALGRDNVPSILSIEAWRSVYLPIPMEPTTLEVDEETWLQCASLPGLLQELEALAASQAMATDRAGLQALWEKHRDDDETTEIQTFIQVFLAAQVAVERSLPLWVVK